MKDVIVCAYATHRQHMIDEYEDQLAAAGIDFHIEPVQLADGIGSVTAGWKFEYMAKMCSWFDMYERIVFTDAWDVLFFGPKERLVKSIPEDFMISAERNCWPEPELASKIRTPTPWAYVNAGMMSGDPMVVYNWCSTSLKMPELDLMEQQWLNRRMSEGLMLFRLDTRTSLFYTVSYDREDGALQYPHRKILFNTRCGTMPMFFHFAGPCSSVPFRAMLRTGEPLCASV